MKKPSDYFTEAGSGTDKSKYASFYEMCISTLFALNANLKIL